ncbi:neutral zinc metallopeptidase [Actinopolymorpha pittospori]
MSYGYGGWPTNPRARRRRRPGILVRAARGLFVLAVLGVLGSVAQQYLSGVVGGVVQGGDIGVPRDTPPETGVPGSGDGAGSGLPDNQASAILGSNRFYTAGGLSDVECPAPDLTNATTNAQRAYDERIFGCLATAWSGPLRRVDLTTNAPRLFVFDSSGSSPCGTFRPREGATLAFYCPVNQTMYADVAAMARSFPTEHHVVYALVLAHEYGHHLQATAGILQAESTLAYQNPALATELSRRTETQASCFAGMFIRSIEESYPVTGLQRRAFDYYARNAFGDQDGATGEDRSHGSSQTQGRWILQGFEDNDTSRCNSFSVSAQEVQ